MSKYFLAHQNETITTKSCVSVTDQAALWRKVVYQTDDVSEDYHLLKRISYHFIFNQLARYAAKAGLWACVNSPSLSDH